MPVKAFAGVISWGEYIELQRRFNVGELKSLVLTIAAPYGPDWIQVDDEPPLLLDTTEEKR